MSLSLEHKSTATKKNGLIYASNDDITATTHTDKQGKGPDHPRPSHPLHPPHPTLTDQLGELEGHGSKVSCSSSNPSEKNEHLLSRVLEVNNQKMAANCNPFDVII